MSAFQIERQKVVGDGQAVLGAQRLEASGGAGSRSSRRSAMTCWARARCR
ncbi:hypothetical protein [Chromohalobacter japonicus]|nr:hypothetical protein [Chromohalobacter japonicus]